MYILAETEMSLWETTWEFILGHDILGAIIIIMFSLFTVVLKLFANSNKLFQKTASTITDRGSDIVSAASDIKDVYNLATGLLSEVEFLKEHINKIEKTEEFVVDILKDFIKSTNIDVNGKLELAQKFQKFEEEFNELSKEKKDEIVNEFKEEIEKRDEKEREQLDHVLSKLKDMPNDDNS